MWANWKRVSRGKYWCAKLPEHPRANSCGYVLEHRVIMENILGRLLLPNEDVHHKDEDGKNNSPDNLRLMLHGKHTAEHHRVEWAKLICSCGKEFSRRPSVVRRRQKLGQKLYCSQRCASKYSTTSTQFRQSLA